MSAQFRAKVTAWVILIDERLQVFLFGLMCIGLVLASWFLYKGLITGDNWVAVCGILFGSNAVGSGLSRFGTRYTASAVKDGSQRPV